MAQPRHSRTHASIKHCTNAGRTSDEGSPKAERAAVAPNRRGSAVRLVSGPQLHPRRVDRRFVKSTPLGVRWYGSERDAMGGSWLERGPRIDLVPTPHLRSRLGSIAAFVLETEALGKMENQFSMRGLNVSNGAHRGRQRVPIRAR